MEMKNIFKILNEVQANEFYEPTLQNNGGGYDQPKITFELNGKKGVFEDTSCGDFGTRYELEYDGKVSRWGSMLSEDEKYSEFTGNEQVFSLLNEKFNVPSA